jgi:Cdc6-like AAA superfamily ATPase
VQVAYLNCMSTRTVNLIYSFILDKFFGGKSRKEMKASESLQMSLRNGRGNEEKTKIIVLD